MDTFGIPYDYQSIMHYTRTTFTKNGQNTLEAKADRNIKLGGGKLSAHDIKKLNKMYQCNCKLSIHSLLLHIVFYSQLFIYSLLLITRYLII